MSTIDGFIAPVFTEVLLTALARQRVNPDFPDALVLGSPWLSDVELFPGIFAGTFPYLLAGIEPEEVATLGEYLKCWRKANGVATIVVQGYHPDNSPAKTSRKHNGTELKFLQDCNNIGVEVLIAHKLHDKFCLVPDVVLSGSANYTYGGLYGHRERLNLHNRSSAPQDFDTSRVACLNHVTAARAAGLCHPPTQPHGVAGDTTFDELRKCYQGGWM